MSSQTLWCFVIVLLLLESVIEIQMSLHENSHGLVQDNYESRFLVDHVSINREWSSVDGIQTPPSHLVFQPQLLDFMERPLGTPHHEKVTLFNQHSNQSVHLSLISGSTVHFHSTFFENKIIPPSGNTSFSVIYLGRWEGPVQSTLVVHTSDGALKYSVQGVGAPCPYRLRPLVGLKAPLNATITPIVYMHNPHDHPLQIVEVYSSGGEFQLELPGSNQDSGPQALWEIPPHSTKPVIRIKFTARHPANHTAYVRIKVSGSTEVLVVPVEVQVTPQPGLHTLQPLLDFGFGGSLDKPKQLKLILYNSGRKGIRLQGVAIQGVSADVISVETHALLVPAGANVPTHVATITLHWPKATLGILSGQVVVRGRCGQTRFVIPLSAHVLEGRLHYSESILYFYNNSNQTNIDGAREFLVTNEFEIPVAITNISLSADAKEHFMISKFRGVILAPGESTVLFNVALRQPSEPPQISTHLQVLTNVSRLQVPVISCSGQLHQIVPDSNDTHIEFGTVAMSSNVSSLWALINTNPIAVKLLEWGTDLSGATIELLGCGKGDLNDLVYGMAYSNTSKCVEKKIPTGYFGLFKVNILAPDTEAEHHGKLWVYTPFQKLVNLLNYRSALGSITIGYENELKFEDCFPGKICSLDLSVHSTFSRSMSVTSISPMPPDPRIIFEGSHGAIMSPHTNSTLGRLHLDLATDCMPKCYTGFDVKSKDGARWLQSLLGQYDMGELDHNLLTHRYMFFKEHALTQNISMKLDTSEVRHLYFATRVSLTWPRLVETPNDGELRVPLTQVGMTGYVPLTLVNPSSVPVVIHVVLGHAYDIPPKDQPLPKEFLPECELCEKTLPNVFTLEGSDLWSESLPALHTIRDGFPIMLPAGGGTTIKILFSPVTNDHQTTIILLRNNLTVLESVLVSGKGAYPTFKFANRKPGSTAPLLFEVSDKHLRDCKRKSQMYMPLTVKRSFIARNTGELPIYISTIKIESLECEGYGFKVLDCQPFALLPNSTRKLDIAFTPDFTLARVQRYLILETSMSDPVNFTLLSTIPVNYLELCSKSLVRPGWEDIMQKILLYGLGVSLILLLIAAFIDSDKVLRDAVNAAAKDKAANVQPTLDLRLAGVNKTAQQDDSKEIAKPKKKLTKKNSCDTSNSSFTTDIEGKRNSYSSPRTPLRIKFTSESDQVNKLIDSIDVTVVKKSQENSNVTLNGKIKKSKTDTTEEENSSTTTESSHTEESDKLIEKSKQDKRVRNNKKHFGHPSVRSVTPISQTSTELSQSPVTPEQFSKQLSDQSRTKTYGKTPGRERKEKQVLYKRKSVPINFSLNNNTSSSNNNNNNNKQSDSFPVVNGVVCSSPPLSGSSMWNENRASFSHVVARNQVQSLNSSSPLYPTPTETSRQPYELGPIGSKKSPILDRTPPLIQRPTPMTSSNSLFLDGFSNSPSRLNTYLKGCNINNNQCDSKTNVAVINKLEHNIHDIVENGHTYYSEQQSSYAVLDGSENDNNYVATNKASKSPIIHNFITGECNWEDPICTNYVKSSRNEPSQAPWPSVWGPLYPNAIDAPAFSSSDDIWGTGWPTTTVTRPPPGLTATPITPQTRENNLNCGLGFDPFELHLNSIWAPQAAEPWPQHVLNATRTNQNSTQNVFQSDNRNQSLH